MQDDQTYEQRVAATRLRFIAGLSERLDNIDIALAAGEDDTSAERHSRTIHRMLHDLAGNAAMLELDAVARSIREGVAIAEAADTQGEALSSASILRIHEVVAGTRTLEACKRKHISEV